MDYVRAYRRAYDILHPVSPRPDHFHIGIRQWLHFFALLQLRVFNDTGGAFDAFLRKLVQVILHLGNMRLLHAGRLLYFMYHLVARIIEIDLYAVNFYFCKLLRAVGVGGFPDQLAFSYDFGGVLHIDAVGKEPELAVAGVEVGDMGGGEHGRSDSMVSLPR